MKNNICIIFSFESGVDEYGYEEMAALLSYSIKKNMPNVSVYCGCFTNNLPGDKILKILKGNNVEVIKDYQFNSGNKNNYFLRNYTKYYFTHIYNLLEQYKKVIYLDIDCIVLSDFRKLINTNLICEEVPDKIIKKEELILNRKLPKKLFYNWIQVLTNNNKYLYDLDYNKLRHEKDSDILISERIIKDNIKYTQPDFTAYYPKRDLKNKYIFHYDGFIDSGSFYKLGEYLEFKNIYLYYIKVLKYILNIEIKNNKEYWK